MDKKFYRNNRNRLFEVMDDNSVIVLYSGELKDKTADEQFLFEVNKNFYYFTGINQDNVMLIMAKSGKERKEMLFIEENDPVKVKWVGEKLYKDQASMISGIEKVFYHSDFIHALNILLNDKLNGIKTVYLDLEQKNLVNYVTSAMKLKDELEARYPGLVIKNAYDDLILLRRVKTKEEIALHQVAIDTTKGALEVIMQNLKPGMYEYQVEAYFDSYIKYDGQKDQAFTTIVASGKNATILHYTANNTKIKDGDLVLFDLGARHEFYISDISRTYPANGKFSERQRQIYEIVLDTNKKCIEYLKPGLSFADYYKYARDLLAKGLKEIGLIKEDSELINYYWHSVGHPIGLDTHDPASRDIPIDDGMIITVEPGLYLEKEGIGVRIEDDVLVTKDGPVVLSKDIIKEVDEIEAYMAKGRTSRK